MACNCKSGECKDKAGTPQTAYRFKWNNVREARRSLSRILNLVSNGRMAEDRGKTLTYIANTILSALRTEEEIKTANSLEAVKTYLENFPQFAGGRRSG